MPAGCNSSMFMAGADANMELFGMSARPAFSAIGPLAVLARPAATHAIPFLAAISRVSVR